MKDQRDPCRQLQPGVRGIPRCFPDLFWRISSCPRLTNLGLSQPHAYFHAWHAPLYPALVHQLNTLVFVSYSVFITYMSYVRQLCMLGLGSYKERYRVWNID